MAKKILSVAADSAIRASREQLLTKAGFDVVSASNIKELIRACEETKFHLFIHFAARKISRCGYDKSPLSQSANS